MYGIERKEAFKTKKKGKKHLNDCIIYFNCVLDIVCQSFATCINLLLANTFDFC